MNIGHRDDIKAYTGSDGSMIRELASPANSPLIRHSLAEIRHPPGTASQEHLHLQAEEVYYVLEGSGEIQVDGRVFPLTRGDIVVIVPGQRHKVWQVGRGDLVLMVTCVPAYSTDDVVFTE